MRWRPEVKARSGAGTTGSKDGARLAGRSAPRLAEDADESGSAHERSSDGEEKPRDGDGSPAYADSAIGGSILPESWREGGVRPFAGTEALAVAARAGAAPEGVIRRDESMATAIDATAVVAPRAQLGVGVRIGPYAIVGENVQVGDHTVIGPHAVLDGWTEIGAECKIHVGAVIGVEPQDLKYDGAKSWVRIGQGNVIREYATVHRATEEDGETRIGDQNLLMAYVHVAHNCVIGNHVILANAVNLAGHVLIEDFAIVGGVTPVHQFVRIGAHSFIGGGSRVPQDIPPYVRCAGNPLRVAGLNSVGLARRGFAPEVVAELKRAYRVIYRSDLNVSQALERIRAELRPYPEVNNFVSFIASSERGITK
jgi:UDP-N-acetylglucosamine acyltransferase